MRIPGLGRRSRHGQYYQTLLTPHEVLDKTFAVKKVGMGYDPDEVDDFLDGVAAAMAGLTPRLTALDIRQHEFALTRRFNSFDFGEVDDFLELIAQTLEYLEAEYTSLPEIPPPPPPVQWGDWGG